MPSPVVKRSNPKVTFSASPRGSRSAPARHFIGALIAGISNRMLASASSHHRLKWDIGMPEWRALISLGDGARLIVREVAETADLDYAQASKALKALSDGGYVAMQQTRSQGRATLVRLTPKGELLRAEMFEVSRQRQKRLLSAFTAQEVRTLRGLLERLEVQIAEMGAEESDGP